MSNNINTGILILAFNRPKSFGKLTQDILNTSNQNIFISIDGGSGAKHLQVKKLANEFKKLYPSRIQLNIMNTNHGVRFGVMKGIDWFYNNIKYGIILEEDLEILIENPDKLFNSIFKFLNTNENCVFNFSTFINKSNQSTNSESNLTFYRNQDFYMWGWAAHRSTWTDFKKSLNKNYISDFLRVTTNLNISEKIYWYAINRLVSKRQIDSWGYSFLFYSSVKKKLYVPSKAIVRNIGLLEGSNYSKLSFFHNDLKNSLSEKFILQNQGIKIVNANRIIFEKNRKVRHNINNYSTIKAIFWNVIPVRHFLKKIKK